MAVTPLGSCTRSRVTSKTRPLKTVLDDKTFSCGTESDSLERALRVLRALLLLAAMDSTIKQGLRRGRLGSPGLLCWPPCERVISERLVVSIVGPGNLGSALALNLRRAGCDVNVLVVRPRKKVSSETIELARLVKAKIVALGEAPLESGLVWITVPDDAIAAVAEKLARTQDWRGRTVFHSSGALTSEVLSPLRARGAKVASVHPGMTFVRQSVPRLEGVPFGVEGDADAVRLAKKLVRDLGGMAFPIKTRNKVLYHAFGTFASPMMIALMARWSRWVKQRESSHQMSEPWRDHYCGKR